MPAVTTNSAGANVVISDDEAQRDALVALREANRQLDAWDASGRRDTAARRMAVNLFTYADMLLRQVDEPPA